MTRAEYDKRIATVKSLCYPILRAGHPLLSNGLPDMAAMLAAVRRKGLAGVGGGKLIDAGLYAPVERPRTQVREKARRLRQMAAA